MGTSFRAPSFQENANGGASAVNSAVGTGAANTVGTCPVVGVKAVPGTIAALIDPNCTQALQFLGGLSLLNSAQSAAAIRPGGVNLTPEKGYNADYGIEFRPHAGDGPFGFLNGLDIQATYWRIRLVNKLQGYFGLAAVTSGTLDNPAYTPAFLTPANDPQFAQHVAALVNSPYSSLPATVTAASGGNPTSGVAFIADGAIRNIGWQYLDGIDLQADYRWRMEGYKGIGSGAWNAGMTGAYNNKNVSNGGPGQLDVNYYTLNNDGRVRYRLRLGWAGDFGAGSGLSVTAFMNYVPHFNPLGNPTPPSCFLIGNVACNASGSYGPVRPVHPAVRDPADLREGRLHDGHQLPLQHRRPAEERLPEESPGTRSRSRTSSTSNRRSNTRFRRPAAGSPHAFYTSTATQELSIGGRMFNLTLTKQW